MPCNTIQTVAVSLGNKNPGLLKEGLEKLGYTVTYITGGLQFYGTNKETGEYNNGVYTDGEFEFTGNLDINQVKRSYAHAAIKKAAGSNNWQLSPTKTGYQAKKSYSYGKEDVIEIEVLSDGTVKSTTDPVSGPNHQSAESFLRDTARFAGGQVQRRPRGTGEASYSQKNNQEEKEHA